MKKLLLLFTLLLSITLFSQKPGAKLSLNKNCKRAFKKGKYSKIEKFLTKKMNCKKYVIDGYDIFKNDYLGDYNYVFNNVDSEAKYYQTIHYSLTNFLNTERRVNYEVYDNLTVMSQSDEEDNYYVIFILGDSPQH
jgi:hypothetical protein